MQLLSQKTPRASQVPGRMAENHQPPKPLNDPKEPYFPVPPQLIEEIPTCILQRRLAIEDSTEGYIQYVDTEHIKLL